MPVPFILRLSGKDRSHVQQYLSKENPAGKMLESATNVGGDTFECECSVDQFRSMLKALRMKRGTNRLEIDHAEIASFDKSQKNTEGC